MSAIAEPTIVMLTAAERRVHPSPGTAPRGSTLTGAVLGLRRMRLPCEGGEFVVEIAGPPPAWVEPTLDAFRSLLAMREGWDSYGARPIDPTNVKTAIELVITLMDDRTPVPSVVPTSAGGVQLEWHTRGIDLEIEIRSPSRISVCFDDQRTQEAWVAEDLYDFGRLRRVLHALARQ